VSAAPASPGTVRREPALGPYWEESRRHGPAFDRVELDDSDPPCSETAPAPGAPGPGTAPPALRSRRGTRRLGGARGRPGPGAGLEFGARMPSAARLRVGVLGAERVQRHGPLDGDDLLWCAVLPGGPGEATPWSAFDSAGGHGSGEDHGGPWRTSIQLVVTGDGTEEPFELHPEHLEVYPRRAAPRRRSPPRRPARLIPPRAAPPRAGGCCRRSGGRRRASRGGSRRRAPCRRRRCARSVGPGRSCRFPRAGPCPSAG